MPDPAYTEVEREEGLTKARLICNAGRDAEDRFADNAAYSSWVCQMAGLSGLPDSALDSYVEQHADKTLKDLEAELAA